MYALAKPAPVTKELIPARGERPAVKVTFNPQPSPLSLRIARRAAAEVLRAGGANVDERAGDAFSGAVIRHNIIGWEGIGDENDQPIEPTPDVEHRNEDGAIVRIEPGTISAFLAEPRLFDAADREYVLPWAQLDAEKNGYAPGPSGTGLGEMPAPGTVETFAAPAPTAAAKPTAQRGRKGARTTGTSRKPRKAKPSGS